MPGRLRLRKEISSDKGLLRSRKRLNTPTNAKALAAYGTPVGRVRIMRSALIAGGGSPGSPLENYDNLMNLQSHRSHKRGLRTVGPQLPLELRIRLNVTVGVQHVPSAPVGHQGGGRRGGGGEAAAEVDVGAAVGRAFQQ